MINQESSQSFTVNSLPCDCYLYACDEQNDFFNSPSWHTVTRTLGARVEYFWSEESRDGFSVSSFRIGPFSISYFSFPVGAGTISNVIGNEVSLEMVARLGLSSNTSAIRVPGLDSSISRYTSHEAASVIETEIEDLQAWKQASLGSTIKRNIRKARKSDVEFSDDIDISFASRIHSLYANTVKRHGGAARYNAKYFFELLKLANKNDSNVNIYGAFLSNELVAYTIVVDHQYSGMYLHGAQDMEHQKYRSMDMLFATMIESAKERGLEKFTFLGSPMSQTNLIRYKEKWGGKSSKKDTITVYGKGVLPKVLRLALKFRGR